MELRLTPHVGPHSHQWAITVYGDDGNSVLHMPVVRDEAIPVMIEAATIYPDLHIEASVEGLRLDREQYPGVVLNFGLPGFIRASIKDGDTGAEVHGDGKSIVNALANMLLASGFKSTLNKDHAVTMFDWLTQFKYGLQRLSDERLAAEMEVIRAPDRGTW